MLWPGISTTDSAVSETRGRTDRILPPRLEALLSSKEHHPSSGSPLIQLAA
jgi:hypothetical protein